MFLRKLKLFFRPEKKAFISITKVSGRNLGGRPIGGLDVNVIITEVLNKGFSQEKTETEYIFGNYYNIKNDWYFYKRFTDDIDLPIEYFLYPIDNQYICKLVDEFCIKNNIELDGKWKF